MNGHQAKVCIIGAGTAGLSALRHTLERPELEVICYEQDKQLGGTWVYQECVHCQDESEVHSSMYRNLRTNLPKEVMGYPDFTYSESIRKSYISSKEVLHFLNSYADHFHLRSHIKFEHEVIRLRPISKANGHSFNWEVYVYNQRLQKLIIESFDFIFVCNGHYTKPQYPQIADMDKFQGTQSHSHFYRSPEPYRDQKVLVIGAGPSGVDLVCHISEMAKRVFLSHHLTRAPSTDYLGNVIQKPDVLHLTRNGACFVDLSVETFDHIIYCTGYQYSFPFLSVDCQLKLLQNHVEPLYKHCINIRHPSMSIVGLPYRALPTQLMDLQIRFSLRYFVRERQLPEEQEMLQDLERQVFEQCASGVPDFHRHRLGHKQYDYYNDLAKLAGLTRIKPAILQIMKECERKYIFELETYRRCNFRLLDEENFIKTND